MKNVKRIEELRTNKIAKKIKFVVDNHFNNNSSGGLVALLIDSNVAKEDIEIINDGLDILEEIYANCLSVKKRS